MVDNFCFVEVNSILNKMDSIEILKIPSDIIEMINKKANNQEIIIKQNKNIEEQISNEALSILTYITLKYLATEEQKKQLKKSLVQNQKEYERKLENIKDIDEIFENRKQTKELFIIEEKESFIKKIMKKICDFFRL